MSGVDNRITVGFSKHGFVVVSVFSAWTEITADEARLLAIQMIQLADHLAPPSGELPRKEPKMGNKTASDPLPPLTPYQNDILSSFAASHGELAVNRGGVKEYLDWAAPILRALNAQTAPLPSSD